MPPTEKRTLVDGLLSIELHRRLSKAFFSIHVSGLEHLKNLSPEKPTIAFSNRTNWWDGFLVFYLARLLPGKRFYCMLDDEQLEQNPFFRWLGAYSIDPDNSVRAAASIRHTTYLLKQPQSLVWMFPQGKMTHPQTPIVTDSGVPNLTSRTSAQLLPAAFGYTFFQDGRPEILVRFGAPFSSSECYEERVAESIQQQVDFVQEAIQKQDLTSFTPIMKPRVSFRQRLTWLHRLVTGQISPIPLKSSPESRPLRF